jgi:KaiC/GvpD/RAD55 family RecA-like ATPase
MSRRKDLKEEEVRKILIEIQIEVRLVLEEWVEDLTIVWETLAEIVHNLEADLLVIKETVETNSSLLEEVVVVLVEQAVDQVLEAAEDLDPIVTHRSVIDRIVNIINFNDRSKSRFKHLLQIKCIKLLQPITVTLVVTSNSL